jgi:hypothetical protein
MTVREPYHGVIDVARSLQSDLHDTFSWRQLDEINEIGKVTSGDGILVINPFLRCRTAVFRHVTDTPSSSGIGV